MKRTEVHYQKTVDGLIRVVDIRYAATEYQIEKEFGAEVRRLYISKPLRFIKAPRTLNDKYSIRVDAEGGRWCHLNVGGLYSQPDFQKRIELMKIAGNRLTEIRKAVAGAAKNPVKVIKI